MTPRQIERAVNASLSRILPPLVQQLRDDLVADLRQHLAARDEGAATDTVLLSALHQHLAGPDALPVAVAVSPALVEAPAAAMGEPASGPWTLGTGSRRRLTEAGHARLQFLLDEGKAAAEIAAELGVSQRTVHGLAATAPAPKVAQMERDATRAEKVRAYQREAQSVATAAQAERFLLRRRARKLAKQAGLSASELDALTLWAFWPPARPQAELPLLDA